MNDEETSWMRSVKIYELHWLNHFTVQYNSIFKLWNVDHHSKKGGMYYSYNEVLKHCGQK